MKVSEFIEWLKTQDQEATVEVICHSDGNSYYDQGGNARHVNFDPSKKYDHWEYTDLRGNKFAEGKPYENERTLTLGGMNT